MLKPIFFYIVPVAFIGLLFMAALVTIFKALRTGTISYGYKYYPDGHTSERKNDPFGFWFGITVYLFCMVVAAFVAIAIMQQ